MTESAHSGMRGTEISERSTELVLPGISAPESRSSAHERKIGVSKPETTFPRERDGQRVTPRAAGATSARSATNGTLETRNAPNTSLPTSPLSATPAEQRGVPLPGDRGKQGQQAPAKQRPSFWRRIALGRRSAKTREEDAQPLNPTTPAPSNSLAPSPSSTTLARRSQAPVADSIEKRIVEPLLQALVSVESKLERSHLDLIGRSDQVEQRLSQLWDIEEQLGTLTELQESLLQVSEQQRRLERSIVAQNSTLRWLVGAVFFSLAVAAFVVAAVLR